MTQPMRVLELCAGIGGFGLACEMVGGYEIVGQVEIDPFCCAVLAQHWPAVKRLGDIREVVGNEFGEVNMVCAGFPCQPNSHAGKRRGRADDRWLWPEIARVVRATGCRWVVLENVPGLLSVDAGGGFADVLRDLAALGYRAGWGVWGAADVGAPHQRDRVFIVGYLGNAGSVVVRTGADQPGRVGETSAAAESAGQISLCDAVACSGDATMANAQHGGWCAGSTPAGRQAGAGALGCSALTGQLAHTHRSGRGSHERHVHARQPHADRAGASGGVADPTRGGLAQQSRFTDAATLVGACAGADGGVERGAVATRVSDDERTNAAGQGSLHGVGLADTDRTRLSQWDGRDAASCGACAAARGDGEGQVEPGVGRKSSRLPAELDGHRWPAGPSEAPHTWEAPRTITTWLPNRAARLKALGNAVVPAQVAPLLLAIAEADAARGDD